ncbi:multi-copper enzyme maturation ABC-type transport system permease component [Campylobacter hyointestinalis]|uniref:Multi-copper enzyme maturation ABC-type transport system permease component n=1 Tax=Campylobacter hyointestinalis subsp. hyointestinalis TaxID=91352 RepID=A0A9W5AWP0_CAMHY|nr:ABC transporter permease subunit [Campylobacter hyointestinalis]PPB52393.1 ABC transporter permease [Campylobacter hyointestinalis subsp. hyointestinalis]PPB56523.1 ABC transporter permease [Campylobacter hyointestinalis subsp. hyointestinalis]PPB61163.1 ABC transporter permease [Campylobacter hyointestinalis subsp. hyointestinalis]PPB65071.1 ABC transporter permease [Campylobacter hyointestinalis subsp. hyointestinalis]PPB65729.1 ABC transporter permease [Campylobacter hyointestinalis subs
MKNLLLIAKIDIKESFRSKWFLLYLFAFAGLIATFFVTGVVDSRVAGFSGLTRMLLLFIQICIIILPIFILITTVRSISSDREAGALEYLLSFPLSLKEYYFGKALGRAFTVFLPILLALVLSLFIAIFKGATIPWDVFFYYTLLLLVLSFVFLSFGFLISSLIKSSELGLGFSFLFWLFLLAFLDLALIGLMMQSSVNENIIYIISLANPVQIFRIAAISLFDPNLAVIGPAAYFILDGFGRVSFLIYSVIYPIILGSICLICGYLWFCKKDLV